MFSFIYGKVMAKQEEVTLSSWFTVQGKSWGSIHGPLVTGQPPLRHISCWFSVQGKSIHGPVATTEAHTAQLHQPKQPVLQAVSNPFWERTHVTESLLVPMFARFKGFSYVWKQSEVACKPVWVVHSKKGLRLCHSVCVHTCRRVYCLPRPWDTSLLFYGCPSFTSY